MPNDFEYLSQSVRTRSVQFLRTYLEEFDLERDAISYLLTQINHDLPELIKESYFYVLSSLLMDVDEDLVNLLTPFLDCKSVMIRDTVL